jgi:single-strand DNA-binding protein
MNTLNSILIEGNLVRNVEPKQTSKGTLVCQMALASNRFYYKDEETKQEVSFFDVEVWDKEAMKVQELEKGRGLRVMGRLKQDRWIDQEGKNHSKVKIVGERVEVRPLFKKQDKEEKAEKGGQGTQSKAATAEPMPAF